jgi:type IV secretion system protein VirB4
MEDALSLVLRMNRLAEYDAWGEDGTPYLQSGLLSHIQHCVSGVSQPLRLPAAPMYLDRLLGSADLVGGVVPRIGDQHIMTLAIDGLPQEFWPAILADLDALSFEYRFSSRFICLDQYDAVKEIRSYPEFNKTEIKINKLSMLNFRMAQHFYNLS